jgi:hypothetical protein
MRFRAGLLLASLLTCSLAIPAIARAESGECREGALAVTGETTSQVLQKCGNPASVQVYPGTGGRYRRLPVEVWVYDRGEGTFPVVLRFVGSVLEEIRIVSRERY